MNAMISSHLPVFVCYAHKDNEGTDPSKRWLDRLLEQLTPLAIQDQVCAWSDQSIETGQNWHERIQQTLKHTKAAVLLVSPAFLASRYIRNSELPVLLKNARDKGTVILPIIVRHCLFKETTFKYPDPVHGPENLSLATLQSANSPSTPLNSLSEHEQDKVLLEVAQRLLAILQTSSSCGSPSTDQPIPASHHPTWNIPLERNPFFTGRGDSLEEIREALLSSGRAAFSGLGGIGKTQTAVEYAYRHKDDYRHILWVKAESRESLTSDFAQLGSILNLPEKQAQDQQDIVNAVQRWLKQHDHWLLIFDNADDLSLTNPFIQGLQSGHILLTTRAQATGTISRVEVGKLPEQEGTVFLLRRAKLIDKGTPHAIIPQELRTQALAITGELDGLPLALDQAGAYIEETQCGLTDYLEIYRMHGFNLLKERGLFSTGHPDPVATTWVLSFQKIEQINPAAAELLRFCAFLHPDGIPEELFTEGASELGPLLGPIAENPGLFNKAIREILKFSLIHRDMNTKAFEIHRLIQVVILNSLNHETRKQWIERLIRALNCIFPDVKFETWSKYDRFLAQALQGASFIFHENLMVLEGARMLNQIAYYLFERARYDDAEPLYQRALKIREQIFGSTHPHVAVILNNLGMLYHRQGKYAKAKTFYQRTLEIREKAFGPLHLHVAQSLNNLVSLYLTQSQFGKTRPLSHRALRIYKLALGPNHHEVTSSLNNLAFLYSAQGKFNKAKPFYQRALRINDLILEADHPKVASSLNNLASNYYDLGEYTNAEPLFQRALAIREKTLGPTHPDVATSLNNLAGLYRNQGKYADAEPLFQRALDIWVEALGPTHPDVAKSLNNLAGLYRSQGKYADAEFLYQSALNILEQALGSEHSETKTVRENYEGFLKKIKNEKN